MGGSCFAQSKGSISAETTDAWEKKEVYPAVHCDSFRTNPQRDSFETLAGARTFDLAAAPDKSSFLTLYNRDSFKTEPQRDSFATIMTYIGRESFRTEYGGSFHTIRKSSFHTVPNRDSFDELTDSVGGHHKVIGGHLDEKSLRLHNNEVIARRFAALRLGA